MCRKRHFSQKELLKADEAAKIAEELVNNYFKMSSGQWLKNRYDIKTAKDLASHEQVDGPFAQVIKYEARKNTALLGSSSYTLYKVCLQDHAILCIIKKEKLLLEPFLLYILTHELIHIIRFSKYKHRYENKNEVDVSLDEERRVHLLSYEILKPFPFAGLMEVFEFYREWRL
ncbi:MAG: hypothetical protein HN417_09570 [Desulfobacula sp.]|jgi:hypothetical protein|nr:hypothetical protein [Desulfobacula sp.]